MVGPLLAGVNECVIRGGVGVRRGMGEFCSPAR